jgi:HEAT repeat protein
LIGLGQAAGRRRGVAPTDLEGLRVAREFLAERLADGRSTDRSWAALALALLERSVADSGLAQSNQTTEQVRRAFVRSKSPQELGALAISLGVIRDSDSASALLKKLDEINDDRARGYICIGLGLMDAREGVETLRDLLATSRYRTLLIREVAISLGLLGDKEVVDDLVEQLRAATSLTAQSSIASALGTIGDARSIKPLLDMLQDQEINVRARAFAAVSLGIVADKEPLPWNAKIAVGVNYAAGTPTLTDGVGAGILDIL